MVINTMLPITKGKIWGVRHGYQHNAADNEGEDLGHGYYLLGVEALLARRGENIVQLGTIVTLVL